MLAMVPTNSGGGHNRRRQTSNGYNVLTNRGFGWLSLICALAAAVIVAALLFGCAPLLTGTNDPGKVQAIMDSIHARGCVYARVSASPWAQAITYLVGTWGDPPPDMASCWQQLPPVAP